MALYLVALRILMHYVSPAENFNRFDIHSLYRHYVPYPLKNALIILKYCVFILNGTELCNETIQVTISEFFVCNTIKAVPNKMCYT